MTTAFWVCAIITVISALTSLGFSLAALRSSGDALIALLYTAARSVALLVVAVGALFTASHGWLSNIALAMVIVQALDAFIGVKQRNLMKTAGPAVLSMANLAALIWLIVV